MTEAYKFYKWTARAEMIASLEEYARTGNASYLGDFLYAVVCNDLMGACSHADQDNKRNLPAFAGYLYNELPSGCHGSPEKVKRWIAQGGTEGRAKLLEEHANLSERKTHTAQDRERLEELTNLLYC